MKKLVITDNVEGNDENQLYFLLYSGRGEEGSMLVLTLVNATNYSEKNDEK